MKTYRSKIIRRYGLTINGTDIYFSSKKMTVKAGILIENEDVKMFEEYRLWYYPINSEPILSDYQRFDRTILINKQ